MAQDSYSCPSGGSIRTGRFQAATALAIAAASMSVGALEQFPAPSLGQISNHGNFPFDKPVNTGDPNAIGLMNSAWTSMADRDPATGTIWFAGGRPLANPLVQVLCRYSAPLDNWRSIGNWSGSAGGHIYKNGCVIPEHRRYFYLPPNNTFGVCPTWNLDTDSVGETYPLPPNNIANASNSFFAPWALVWHPNLGNQGSVLGCNSSADRIIRFDWETKTWIGIGRFDTNASAVIQIDWTNLHPIGHYNALHDSVIFGSSDFGAPEALVRIDNTGAASATPPIDAEVNCGGTGGMFFQHPSDVNQSIIICQQSLRIHSYNWTTNTFTDRGPVPLELSDFDTIASVWPDEGVVLFAVYGAAGTSETFLWKPGF